jgi:hypothetical protein
MSAPFTLGKLAGRSANSLVTRRTEAAKTRKEPGCLAPRGSMSDADGEGLVSGLVAPSVWH